MDIKNAITAREFHVRISLSLILTAIMFLIVLGILDLRKLELYQVIKKYSRTHTLSKTLDLNQYRVTPLQNAARHEVPNATHRMDDETPPVSML